MGGRKSARPAFVRGMMMMDDCRELFVLQRVGAICGGWGLGGGVISV